MTSARALSVLVLVSNCACNGPLASGARPPLAARSQAETAGSASGRPGEEPRIPEAIAVAPPLRIIVKAIGRGVQIYGCAAKDGPLGTYAWSLSGPEADLFDDAGAKIGKHYAGPTWEANDGSKVVGSLKAKVDAPDGASIPWLLLDAKATEAAGAFSQVKSIQRIDTAGGKAPSVGCDAAHAGAVVRVPYSAIYYLYGL